MWRFTVFPSFMLEHLFSLLKLELIIDCGGSIVLPPSMKRINLCSSCRSLRLYLVPFMPKQMTPSAHPAASEYPSRSKHLSLFGRRPICDSVISVIVRLLVPLCNNPIPMSAEVCTLIGISMSTVGGRRQGICRISVFDSDSSHFPMLEADTPRRMAALVNSLFGLRY